MEEGLWVLGGKFVVGHRGWIQKIGKRVELAFIEARNSTGNGWNDSKPVIWRAHEWTIIFDCLRSNFPTIYMRKWE